MKNHHYLHAFEYMLNLLNEDSEVKSIRQPLQLVIEVDGELWTGSLLRQEGIQIFSYYLDDEMEEVYVMRSPEFRNQDRFLLPIHGTYLKYGEALRTISDEFLLYQTISKLIDMTLFSDVDTDLEPVIYDARLIDGSFTLPFFYFGDKEATVVSLVPCEDFE